MSKYRFLPNTTLESQVLTFMQLYNLHDQTAGRSEGQLRYSLKHLLYLLSGVAQTMHAITYLLETDTTANTSHNAVMLPIATCFGSERYIMKSGIHRLLKTAKASLLAFSHDVLLLL